MATVNYGALPFEAQIAFFKKKLALSSQGWTDLWQNQHDHAFVVAGAVKMALVEDFQSAVQKALENGTTLAAFRQDFEAIVAKHGWRHHGQAGWRSRLIYQTNLRTAYAAGRYTQLQRLDYWQYHHAHGVTNPRPQHLHWDRLILPKDHAFWQTHYPPNGWGCRCKITGMNAATLARRGLSVSDDPVVVMAPVTVGKTSASPRTVNVPEGIDPGFAYAPGRSAWMQAHVPPPKGQPPKGFASLIPDTAATDALPPPRAVSAAQLLPENQAPEVYVTAFLNAFDTKIGQPIVYTDAAGEPLVISDALFKRTKNQAWKATKNGREVFTLLMAETIKQPDEIWVAMEWNHALGKAMVRRRYLTRFQNKDTTSDGISEGFGVFEYARDGWSGVTTYARDLPQKDDLDREIARLRRGVRVYKKGDADSPP